MLSRCGSRWLQGIPVPKPRDDEPEEHKQASQLAKTVAILVVSGLWSSYGNRNCRSDKRGLVYSVRFLSFQCMHVGLGAFPFDAPLAFKINFVQAELHFETFSPFIIVGQRPVEISSDINILLVDSSVQDF